MNNQINEQVVLLEQELSRLKKVTDYIETAKSNSALIISALEQMQQNYIGYMRDLHDLYEKAVLSLREDVQSQIECHVMRIEELGRGINKTNQGLFIEVQELLKRYENITAASNSLIENMNAIDIPGKLNIISSTADLISVITTDSKEEINILNEMQRNSINEISSLKDFISKAAYQNSNQQKKQITTLHSIKIISLVICGMIILNIILMFIN